MKSATHPASGEAHLPNGPICPSCDKACRLTDGNEVYAHRPDLHSKPIWICDLCGGYVGCHPNTTKPLGTPAQPDLRRARMILHDKMIDPLWKNADRCNALYTPEDDRARLIIRKAARGRVYAYLGAKLGIPRKEVHTGHFDLATCRRAWRALQGVTYPQIRDWYKSEGNTHVGKPQ